MNQDATCLAPIYLEFIARNKTVHENAKVIAYAILKFCIENTIRADILDEEYWDAPIELKRSLISVFIAQPNTILNAISETLERYTNEDVTFDFYIGSNNSTNNLIKADINVDWVYSNMYARDCYMGNRGKNGVVATHLPSGFSARCTALRAGHENKAEALKLLEAKVLSASYSGQTNVVK